MLKSLGLKSELNISEEEIIGHFDGVLARYKHPRAVQFFETLPRNAMGKVLKFELREQFASAAATE